MNQDNPSDEKDKVFKMRVPATKEQVLSLPPQEALDAIINSANSTALVQSFHEEDLYLLIHEIGVDDSLPLLERASDQQWEYFLDVEAWDKDRIEMISYTRWLNLLLEADPKRLVGAFFNQHIENMELFLFKSVEVKVRNYDQDPGEFGDEYFTIDDFFYLKVIDDIYEDEIDADQPQGWDSTTASASEPEEGFEEDRIEFLIQFLRWLADYDHIRYQNILFEVAAVIPAEVEEETFRLRNVRMAEKGFLPFDEAVGIYQPLRPEDIDHIQNKPSGRISDPEIQFEVPYFPGKFIPEGGLFAEALNMILNNDLLQQLQGEFAGLSNQLISADRLKIQSRNELEAVIKKACGYISIGLEETMARRGAVGLHQASELLSSVALQDLFKIGYGAALKLKWQTEKWQEKSWPAQHGLPLGFWGEKWLGILGGLLIKKPLFYDNYKTGDLYREFASLDDVRTTEKELNIIITVDTLLTLLSVPDVSFVSNSLLSYKNLILTLWAKHYLGISPPLEPLTLKELKHFFSDLLVVEEGVSRVPIDMKTCFLEWLSDTTGLSQSEIASQLGDVLDPLFQEIEDEYGNVSADLLDPRYILHFLVK